MNWTDEQINKWKYGNWTKEKVQKLEDIADYHIVNCNECQSRLSINPDTLSDDEPYYCPTGECLMDDYLDANTEFSWQIDKC